MTEKAEVKLWNSTIGAVTWADGATYATFQYSPEFIRSGIQLAPIQMPLRGAYYEFPALSKTSFNGLPGLLADSLPDSFGNALIQRWLSTQGRPGQELNPVEKLKYTGLRGMGALEYHPPGATKSKAKELEIDKLAELADEILRERSNFSATLTGDEDLEQILQIGTSAGGARAKAVVALGDDEQTIYSGQVKGPEGSTYWLMKFDGVENAADGHSIKNPAGYGKIEYAYSLMAKDAGIDMTECRLFIQEDRSHFMTKRFDRTDEYQKLHVQSFGAMMHFDFNEPNAYSYEQAFGLNRTLRLGAPANEELFRRAVFNIVAMNCDDHVKNISYIMDRKGVWKLAPAFDMTYSYDPTSTWVRQHQMALNNKRTNFVLEDLIAGAENASIRPSRAQEIVDEVQASVRRWMDFSEAAGVESERAGKLQDTFVFFN